MSRIVCSECLAPESCWGDNCSDPNCPQPTVEEESSDEDIIAELEARLAEVREAAEEVVNGRDIYGLVQNIDVENLRKALAGGK